MKLVLGAALAAGAAASGASYRGPERRAVETRVVPSLADPAIVPGVARCTSDGVCLVTDAFGTRRVHLSIAR